MSDEWSDERWDETNARVRVAAHEVLAAGPLTPHDLTVRLADQGVLVDFDGCEIDDLVEIVADAMAETDETWMSETGVICLSKPLLDAVVLTHRVSAGELERGLLDSSPDLGVLAWGPNRRWALSAATGEVAHEYRTIGGPGVDEHGSFVGPEGWLDGVVADQLVGATCDGQQFTLVRDVAPKPPSEEPDLLRQVFDGMFDDAFVVEVDQLLLEVLLRDADIFRTPSIPVIELLGLAGLRVRGDWVGRADHDFVTPSERYRHDLLDRLSSVYRLDSCCREALQRLIANWATFVVSPPEHREEIYSTWNPLVLFEDLHHGVVAPALVDYIWDRHNHRVELLDEFAGAVAMYEELEPPALYLVACNALRGGSADEALRALQRASELEGGIGPAMELHATLLADAGRAGDALAALRRAREMGAPEHEIAFLSGLLKPFLAAGRNDPCPCGSGRKYKQCCQHELKLTPSDRRRLALHQASRSLYEPRRQELPVALAMAAIDASRGAGSDSEERVEQLLGDPFLLDLALFEEGTIAEYVRERRAIIPEAELAWLESLAASRRRVWDFRRIDGDRYEARDAASGDVAGPIMLDARAFGDEGHMFARIIGESIDGSLGVLGPAHSVSPAQRDELVELLDADADGLTLAAWFGEQMAAAARDGG